MNGPGNPISPLAVGGSGHRIGGLPIVQSTIPLKAYLIHLLLLSGWKGYLLGTTNRSSSKRYLLPSHQIGFFSQPWQG